MFILIKKYVIYLAWGPYSEDIAVENASKFKKLPLGEVKWYKK